MKNCDCEICKNNHDFEICDDLMNDLLSGDVTLFAGAGISTESKSVLNYTFYQQIENQLDLLDSNKQFPELMEELCGKPNGRIKLLKTIKNRFETIDSFPELNLMATKFHRELGTFYFIKNIITTNWDTYFEQFCQATPFVSDMDLVFWEAADRRVLKIHGSIENLSTIVATSSDYSRCKEELNVGVIGSFLKSLLATQTILFVGYSLRDSDFNEIYDYVKEKMNFMHKQAYIITPFKEEGEKFRALGLIPIITDGTYFFNCIKKHAESEGHYISDEVFDFAKNVLDTFIDEHHVFSENVDVIKHPQSIYSFCYQDGVIHALQRGIKMKYSGRYSHSCIIKGSVREYMDILANLKKEKNFIDVAYIEGYLNGLIVFLLEGEKRSIENLPMYFTFDLKNDFNGRMDEYIQHLKSQKRRHNASLKYAKKYIKKLSLSEKVVFHHPPHL